MPAVPWPGRRQVAGLRRVTRLARVPGVERPVRVARRVVGLGGRVGPVTRVVGPDQAGRREAHRTGEPHRHRRGTRMVGQQPGVTVGEETRVRVVRPGSLMRRGQRAGWAEQSLLKVRRPGMITRLAVRIGRRVTIRAARPLIRSASRPTLRPPGRIRPGVAHRRRTGVARVVCRQPAGRLGCAERIRRREQFRRSRCPGHRQPGRHRRRWLRGRILLRSGMPTVARALPAVPSRPMIRGGRSARAVQLAGAQLAGAQLVQPGRILLVESVAFVRPPAEHLVQLATWVVVHGPGAGRCPATAPGSPVVAHMCHDAETSCRSGRAEHSGAGRWPARSTDGTERPARRGNSAAKLRPSGLHPADHSAE